MTAAIGLVTLVVHDQDEALRFYCQAVGFDVVQDRLTDDGRRWLVLAPPGGVGPGLLLARAETPAQAPAGETTGLLLVAWACRCTRAD